MTYFSKSCALVIKKQDWHFIYVFVNHFQKKLSCSPQNDVFMAARMTKSKQSNFFLFTNTVPSWIALKFDLSLFYKTPNIFCLSLKFIL